MDNCPAHSVVENLINIEVVYLPPNTTSQTQPCNQGIIQALNLYNETEFPTIVLDAIMLLKQAWDEVPLSPWPTASGTPGLFMIQMEKQTTC